MRRRSAGVLPAEQLVAALVAEAESYEPERVIRVLEPLVLDSRRDRLLEVTRRRLGSVAVVFEAPHDPHNGAAVIRSCEAFGVQEVHVVESREPFLIATTVARSAEKWVDLRCHARPEDAVLALKDKGFELVAARADGELLPAELARLPRPAIVLGNERDGISDELLVACARSVRVPMRGFVESLNVSVSAAILLAAATAGREGDLSELAQSRFYARCLYLSVAHAGEILAENP